MRRNRKRALTVTALAIAATVLPAVMFMTARSAVAESASPAPKKAVLRIGWPTEPDNLNVFTGYLSASYEMWRLNYDMLVGFRAGDYSNHPEIAKSWMRSDDGLVWTFQIRKGMKWSDGQPVTARDVEFTFNYIIKNDMPNFTVNVGSIESVKATSDYEVVITCSEPKANMLGIWQPILPEHIWSEVDPKEAASSYQVPLPLVGSGPFQVAEFKRGKYVRLVANKDYWRGAPKVDEIIFQYYKDPVTMVFDLQQGRLDAAVQIPSAQYSSLKSKKGITPYAYILKGFDHLGFNCYDSKYSTGDPVLRDAAFRYALTWAVDRDEVASLSYKGLAQPATSLIAPGFSKPDYHYDPPADEVVGFDLEKAATLLEEAGYPLKDGVRVDKDGKPIELRLAVRSASPEQQSAGKLIAGWFDTLGLKIRLQTMDDGSLMDRIWAFDGDQWAPDFDMFIWSWTGNVDPSFMLSLHTTEQFGSWGEWGWSNKEYDDLYTEQAQTIDPAARKKLTDRMQQLLLAAAPDI